MPDYRTVFHNPKELAEAIKQQEAAHAVLCALGPVIAELGHVFAGQITLQDLNGAPVITLSIKLQEKSA